MKNKVKPRLLQGDVLLAGVPRSENDEFALGDLVTRDGSDLHLVTNLYEGGDTGEFLCVQAPTTEWILVDAPGSVWCEVLDTDLHMIEETLPCSPTLTECPRCKNNIRHCDGDFVTPNAALTRRP